MVGDRDDLYITGPSDFRCPISLDVMKFPVSLCTGVTYDRDNIQRWLDGGHNTCPVTMQVLKTKDFVPNHTLQRLIQTWNESATATRRRPNSAGSSKEQVAELVRELKENRTKNLGLSLSKIESFARESGENRKFLAELDQFIPMLVGFLGKVDEKQSESVNFVEAVVRVLELVSNSITDREELKNLMIQKSDGDCLSSMLLVLQVGNHDSKIASAKIFNSIAMDAESKLVIGETKGLLSVLLNSVTPESNSSLIEASLSCLISISSQRRTKVKLIQLDAVKFLAELLTEQNSPVSIIEKSLELLEIFSTCREGRSEICEDSRCIVAVVQKLLQTSTASSERAVTILWTICYVSKNRKAQELVLKNNGLTRMVILLQSGCSPALKQTLNGMINWFMKNYKINLTGYETKTMHIMPF